MTTRYRLKLSKLQFCSIVDHPAQPHAKTLLIKRAAGGDKITATARIAKLDEALGLAFFWAFTSTNPDGTEHFDLQGDTVDQDFVKAAMEFMTDGGGAVDEMHDGKPGAGRVVFAMPMTPDIAAAFGVVTKTIGLMVAIKPAPDVLAKLKDGTYNGVSIGGVGTREAVKRAATPPLFRRVLKQAVLTDEVDGHQHTLDLNNPTKTEDLCTSWATATTDDGGMGHSHAWVYDPTSGAITIATNAGHTHTVDAVVPPEVLAAAVLDEIEDEPSDAIPVAVPDEKSSGATVVVVSARHAASAKSTHARASATVKPQEKEHAMPNEHETKIADLEKRLALFTSLNGPQKGYYDTLTGPAAEEFLTKSVTERDSIVVAKRATDAAAGEIEFTSPVDGTVYRKSDDPRLVAMAKREAKSVAEAEQVRLEKRAETVLKHFGKELKVRAAIIKAIDAIADEAVRTEALAAITAADRAMAELGIAKGYSPAEDPNAAQSPFAAFNKALGEFAKTKNKSPALATTEFLNTPEGAALYAATA